jgi:hypothetical protein
MLKNNNLMILKTHLTSYLRKGTYLKLWALIVLHKTRKLCYFNKVEGKNTEKVLRNTLSMW